jgi:hypothetical protein
LIKSSAIYNSNWGANSHVTIYPLSPAADIPPRVPLWALVELRAPPNERQSPVGQKPVRTHEARLATLIDDTKANNQLVIVDISYDSSSSSGKADAERIAKPVTLK